MLTCVKWEAEVVKCKIIKCYVYGRKLVLSVHQDISRYLDKIIIIISKYTTVTGWLCTKCGTLGFSGTEYESG